MARDYEALARTIVELVGGEDNVKSVTHCITRLRFTLNDDKKAQTEKLNQTEGVISVLQAAGQYQVVIGNHVTDVYDALPKVSNIQLGGEVEAEAGGNIVNRAIQLISGIFMPMLPAMSAAGLLKAFVIMANSFGWLAADSTTYQLLYAIGDGVFYFMRSFLPAPRPRSSSATTGRPWPSPLRSATLRSPRCLAPATRSTSLVSR